MINKENEMINDLLEARDIIHSVAEKSFVLYEYRNELRNVVKDIDCVMPNYLWHSDREKACL